MGFQEQAPSRFAWSGIDRAGGTTVVGRLQFASDEVDWGNGRKLGFRRTHGLKDCDSRDRDSDVAQGLGWRIR